MRRKRTALPALTFLIGLVTVPVILTWREVRHEQLNHSLVAAIDRNDAAGVRSLVRQGADPNAPVLPEDKRPVWKRLWDVVRNRAVPRPHAFNSVLCAAVNGQPHTSFEDDRPENTADSASQNGHLDMVRLLLAAGADVNGTGGSNRRTPLMAVASGLDDCKINLVIMRLLLAHGATVNATGENGWSALTWAVTTGSADGVKLLLNNGANARIRDIQNASLIQIARGSDHRNPRVVRLLQVAGAKD